MVLRPCYMYPTVETSSRNRLWHTVGQVAMARKGESMAIKKSVFGSSAEKENFRRLRRNWGDKYALYHNLPFLNVFSIKAGAFLPDPHSVTPRLFTLSGIEVQQLKKTSIDYILCDQDDAPLVCVEFDGMNQGYSSGDRYRPGTAEDGPHDRSRAWRHHIMELKLKVAHAHLFPLFVVGYKEFQNLSPRIQLTIVDGVIGEVIANMESRKRFSAFEPSGIGMSEEEFLTLPPGIRDDLVRDWIMGVEAEAGFEHNPILKEQYKLRAFLRDVLGERLSLSYDFLNADKLLTGGDRIGAEVVLHTKAFGDIKQRLWMPNFQAPVCLGLDLIMNIVELLVLDQARTLYERKLTSQEFSV